MTSQISGNTQSTVGFLHFNAHFHRAMTLRAPFYLALAEFSEFATEALARNSKQSILYALTPFSCWNFQSVSFSLGFVNTT